MTDEKADNQAHGVLGVLLAPLRAPQRMVTDIETIASALVAVRDRLASVDNSAGALVGSVGALQGPVEQMDRKITKLHKDLVKVITQHMSALQAPLDRVDRKVTELATLEQAITERMDTIDSDLDARMLAIEQEVRALHPPIDRMAADVTQVVALLPDPTDGPLARLKDTFSSAS